jgi:hypothetical protein
MIVMVHMPTSHLIYLSGLMNSFCTMNSMCVFNRFFYFNKVLGNSAHVKIGNRIDLGITKI